MKAFAYHFGASGVAWYRVWQPVKYLQRRGVDITRLPNESDRIEIPNVKGKSNYPGITNHREIAEGHDVIFSQHRTIRKDAFRLIDQAQIAQVVIDIDDNLFAIHPSNPNYKSWLPLPDEIEELVPGKENSPEIKQRVERGEGVVQEYEGKKYFVVPGEDKRENVMLQLRQAAHVTVSTPELKRVYQHLNPNISVMPNGVDFDLWTPKPNTTDKFRIGLFGSNTHFVDWKEAADGINKFLKDFPDAVLVTNATLRMVDQQQGERFETSASVPVVHDSFVDMWKSGRVEMHKPSEVEKYPAWLADKMADVILAPLADTTFNKAKSNIKYLESAALKVPTICSDMEPYNSDIKHGYNGLLAKKPSDWYSMLKRVYQDRSAARAMGNRAWMDAKNRYDMALIAAKYETLFLELAQRGPRYEKADTRHAAFA